MQGLDKDECMKICIIVEYNLCSSQGIAYVVMSNIFPLKSLFGMMCLKSFDPF